METSPDQRSDNHIFSFLIITEDSTVLSGEEAVGPRLVRAVGARYDMRSTFSKVVA